MGYSVGYDDGRTIGYGVPAPCDYPGCDTEIDRGLGWKCETSYTYVFDEETEEETETYDPDGGCGLFFCSDHLYLSCQPEHDTLQGKPDPVGWKLFQLLDDSWARWREENPRTVAAYEEELKDPDVLHEAALYVKRHEPSIFDPHYYDEE